MLVSILMPSYNTEEYIEDAIKSCLAQTYEFFELIIINDGSTDNTLNIIKSFNDSRIVPITIPHSGVSASFNTALEESCGDIIARMDSDDLQDPSRIEKSIRDLKDGSYYLTSCKMEYLFLNGRREKELRNSRMNKEKYCTGRGGHPVNASIVAYKEVYDKIGGFKEELITASDGDWNFRVLKQYENWGFVDEHLYTYRQHKNQTSRIFYDEGCKIHIAARRNF